MGTAGGPCARGNTKGSREYAWQYGTRVGHEATVRGPLVRVRGQELVRSSDEAHGEPKPLPIIPSSYVSLINRLAPLLLPK